MRKLRIPFLLFLLITILSAGVASALEVGKPAPDFELPTLEGKTVRLSDFKGQVIVLKLATTWCPTCRQQTAEIKDAGNFLKEKNVAVVEVFLQDSEAMVRDYLKGEKFEMPFAALLDDGRAHKAYNVYVIPRVLIIDRDFAVRHDGSLISARDLIKEIEAILGGS